MTNYSSPPITPTPVPLSMRGRLVAAGLGARVAADELGRLAVECEFELDRRVGRELMRKCDDGQRTELARSLTEGDIATATRVLAQCVPQYARVVAVCLEVLLEEVALLWGAVGSSGSDTESDARPIGDVAPCPSGQPAGDSP